MRLIKPIITAAISTGLLLAIASPMAYADDTSTAGAPSTGAPTAAAVASSSPSPTSTPKPTKTTPATPQPVRNIQWQTGGDPRSVVLSWLPPSGSNANTYTVTLTGTFNGKDIKVQKTSTPNAYVLYTNIQPATKLRAQVETSARASAGYHDYSPAYTQPQVKPGAIQNLNTSVAGVTLNVTWSTPASNDGGTLITGYTINLYQGKNATDTTGKKIQTTKIDNTKTKTSFPKLKGKTYFFVTVAATNSAGTGSSTKSTPVQTGVGSTPTATPTPTPTPTDTFATDTPDIAPTPIGGVLPQTSAPTTTTPTHVSQGPDTGTLLIFGGLGVVVIGLIVGVVLLLRKFG